MKVTELLREMSEVEFEFDMMERLLKKNGFSPVKSKNTRSLTVDVGPIPGGSKKRVSFEVFPIDMGNDDGRVVWFFNSFFDTGPTINHIPDLRFDEVVPRIKHYLKQWKITENIEQLHEMSEQDFQVDMVSRLLKKSGFDPKWSNYGECLEFTVYEFPADTTYTVQLFSGTSKDGEVIWFIELVGDYGDVVERIRNLSFDEVVPSVLALLKKRGITEGVEYDPAFKMLDGTNPAKPYSQTEIMAAMKQLHARIERQAADYGNKIDRKTGKLLKTSKFHDAQIAADE